MKHPFSFAKHPVAAAAATVFLALLLAGCAPATVSRNAMVQMAYKGTLTDGTVFSQSEAGKPMEFMVGAGTLIPALEKGMLGMKVGDKRTIQVKAADAYGEYDKTAVQRVPRKQFPKDLELKVGGQYQFNSHSGPIVVTVTALDDASVTLDFNHPLAGKDLTFEVTVVKIRAATKEELAKAAGAASAAPSSTAPSTPAQSK
ncbi:MAG TPA: peptidylprolyl isomerase [bacterium]|nr:peptidylprolyl isomerase [bacterium]